MQIHEIIRMDDPDRMFATGGALEALLAAKQAGKMRFIGFTGHKDPKIHLRMLDVADAHDVHFDTVQMPLNVMDAHFRSFTRTSCRDWSRNNRLLAMKTFGGPFIYDAVVASGIAKPIELLHYSMTLPVRGNHRYGPDGTAGSGDRSREDVSTPDGRPGRNAPGEDEGGGGRRRVREVQDDDDVRRDDS